MNKIEIIFIVIIMLAIVLALGFLLPEDKDMKGWKPREEVVKESFDNFVEQDL